MVKQYPYKLQVFVKTESVQDEDTGNWISGTEEWQDFTNCRDEGNGSGAKITTEDGEVYVYGAVIQMPKNAPRVQKGAKIQVVGEHGEIRLSGDCVQFRKDQLHSRLWV